MLADAVVAVVDDDHLPAILPLIHRNGLGHVARVMKRERGDLRTQLRRAGVPVEQSPAALDAAGRILLVTAAARSQPTAELLLRNHAIAVWIVTRQGFWRDIDDRAHLIAPTPDLAPSAAIGPDIRLPDAIPTQPAISLTEDAPGNDPA
ncbi:MAG: hypothetical protein QM589_17505 [Thermomicrobiales bacterium]